MVSSVLDLGWGRPSTRIDLCTVLTGLPSSTGQEGGRRVFGGTIVNRLSVLVFGDLVGQGLSSLVEVRRLDGSGGPGRRFLKDVELHVLFVHNDKSTLDGVT